MVGGMVVGHLSIKFSINSEKTGFTDRVRTNGQVMVLTLLIQSSRAIID